MEYEPPAQDRRKSGSLQTQNQGELQKQNDALQQQLVALRQQQSAQPNVAGGRIAPVRQSRILDRPPKKGEKDSSLKIKVELDLEVEVSRPHLPSALCYVLFFYKMNRWTYTLGLRAMLLLDWCDFV